MSNIKPIISRPVLCEVMGVSLHYFWFTTFLIMTCISAEFFYCFSNICKPWFVKRGKNKKKVKYCWILSFIIMAVIICVDKLADIPFRYGSERGICFIEPGLYVIILFIGPVFSLIAIQSTATISISVKLNL